MYVAASITDWHKEDMEVGEFLHPPIIEFRDIWRMRSSGAAATDRSSPLVGQRQRERPKTKLASFPIRVLVPTHFCWQHRRKTTAQ